MHELFTEYLSLFSVKPEFIEPLLFEIEHDYYEFNKENMQREQILKMQLSEVE